MPISETAKTILEYVKENGGKLTGGIVKSELGLKDSEFKSAKGELKTYGLVELGRGRGGTITYIEGVPLPTEAPKRSRSEILADAREEREAKSRQAKKYKKIISDVLEKAAQDYPQLHEDNLLEFDSAVLNEGIAYVRLWDEGHNKATTVGYYIDD
jgi:hypothetical protein